MAMNKPLHVGPTRKGPKEDCGCGKGIKVNDPRKRRVPPKRTVRKKF